MIARGFKQPSVLLMGENKLVTMLCRDETLFRCTSSDSGHRWNFPEQILLAVNHNWLPLDPMPWPAYRQKENGGA